MRVAFFFVCPSSLFVIPAGNLCLRMPATF
jgi:hypothetical protein